MSTPLEFSQDATSFVGYNDAESFYSEDATIVSIVVTTLQLSSAKRLRVLTFGLWLNLECPCLISRLAKRSYSILTHNMFCPGKSAFPQQVEEIKIKF